MHITISEKKHMSDCFVPKPEQDKEKQPANVYSHNDELQLRHFIFRDRWVYIKYTFTVYTFMLYFAIYI